ncbi:SHOCT domain-containing protein [Fructilactobacillus frigidiflavus]|uniref:SHOCT domain-containing protein n=1 Tax=Fructilactobacillus frigidiflavus TaxID=3242688 RepID=UPI0037568BC0
MITISIIAVLVFLYIKYHNKKKNSANELINLKKLLDKGIITQEEFDKKKKDILGL